jgi:purine nucleoside phosphorylase
VPLNREFSVVENVINFSNKKLTSYFKEKIQLDLFVDSGEAYSHRIRNIEKFKHTLRLP